MERIQDGGNKMSLFIHVVTKIVEGNVCRDIQLVDEDEGKIIEHGMIPNKVYIEHVSNGKLNQLMLDIEDGEASLDEAKEILKEYFE